MQLAFWLLTNHKTRQVNLYISLLAINLRHETNFVAHSWNKNNTAQALDNFESYAIYKNGVSLRKNKK